MNYSTPKTEQAGFSIQSALHELLKPMGVYLVLSLINVRVKMAITVQWVDGFLDRYHKLCMAFRSINHDQCRVLQFWIPELLVRTFGVTIPDAYMFQRWLFVSLAFCCFHLYLRRWFSRAGAFAGVLFLAAVMPLTYKNHLQESAPLLMLLFLLALWAIRERRTTAYVILLCVGAMTNETILILPAAYFTWSLKQSTVKHTLKVLRNTLLTCFPAFTIAAVIRYVTRDCGGYSGDIYFPAENIGGIYRDLFSSPLIYWRVNYIGIILIYGVFWVFAFWRFSHKPAFLRRTSLIIPIFVAIHIITGRIEEVRQMIPLAFLIIPMGMCTLLDESDSLMDQS